MADLLGFGFAQKPRINDGQSNTALLLSEIDRTFR